MVSHSTATTTACCLGRRPGSSPAAPSARMATVGGAAAGWRPAGSGDGRYQGQSARPFATGRAANRPPDPARAAVGRRTAEAPERPASAPYRLAVHSLVTGFRPRGVRRTSRIRRAGQARAFTGNRWSWIIAGAGRDRWQSLWSPCLSSARWCFGAVRRGGARRRPRLARRARAEMEEPDRRRCSRRSRR